MAWLSRINFTSADVLSYTALNNLGNDDRNWGGDVNGGGYKLSNVTFGTGMVLPSPTFVAPLIITSATTNLLMAANYDAATGTGVIQVNTYGNAFGSGLMLEQARGTLAAPADAVLNDRVGAIFYMAYAGGAFAAASSVETYLDAAGTVSASSVPAHLRFYTCPNGSAARLERVRITSDGHVGIGTTTPAYFNPAGTARAYLTIKGSTASGVLEMASGAADGVGGSLGLFQVLDLNITGVDKRTHAIQCLTDGGTPNNRGGTYAIFTRPDNGTTIVEAMRITNAGNVGIGAGSPLAGSVGWNLARHYLTVMGSTDIGVLELATANADADGAAVGQVSYTDPTNTTNDKRIAAITGGRNGATAGNRGGALLFNTRADNAAVFVERMRIDNAGNVGIGYTFTTPLFPITGPQLVVGGTTVPGDIALTGPGAGAFLGRVNFVDSSSAASDKRLAAIVGIGNTGNGNLSFYTWNAGTPTSRLFISNAGNVGIGTATPGAPLSVYSTTVGIPATIIVDGAAGAQVQVQNYYPSSGGSSLALQASRGSLATPADVVVGDRLGALFFAGNTSAAFRFPCSIEAYAATGTVSASSLPGYLAFFTCPDGSTGRLERVRIDSSGFLLAGYTASQGAYKLQVNSAIFATSATIVTSDGRYKTNVQPIKDALKLVNKLRPVCFEWMPHPAHDFNLSGPSVGFIAQEVDKVLAAEPYLRAIVAPHTSSWTDESGDEKTEEFWGLGETLMIPLLTEAIQELTKRVLDLERRMP